MLLLGAVLAGDLSAASTKDRLQAKRAQEDAVLAQVNALDGRFEASVEAWNGAQYLLERTKQELVKDRRTLGLAERQRRLAVARVNARLVALYEGNDDMSTIGILFGSSSVSDLLARLDAAHAVAAADHRLAVQTTAARNRYAAAARRTAAVEHRREVAVAQRASERQQIGSLLAERKRLLASVQADVSKLQAQQAREQAAAAAAARARIAAAEAAAQREELAREHAAAAAKARAQQPAPATTTTTPSPASAPPPAPVDPPADPATTTTASPPAPAPAPAPAAAAAGTGHPEAAQIAMRYLGVPYAWGGASPAGFDCSGLVMYVFAQIGVVLPHFAAAQYQLGAPVARDQLQPGDLVFFDGLNHVGIYVGGGAMIHAPHTGAVVQITPLSSFGGSYVGARRV
jgi:cell wall-associated NlpC family hydrolase